MKEKIHISELYRMAKAMKYSEFASYLASQLGGIPETVESSNYTDKLFLFGVINNEMTVCNPPNITNCKLAINKDYDCKLCKWNLQTDL